jgi:hypothetical protein
MQLFLFFCWSGHLSKYTFTKSLHKQCNWLLYVKMLKDSNLKSVNTFVFIHFEKKLHVFNDRFLMKAGFDQVKRVNLNKLKI